MGAGKETGSKLQPRTDGSEEEEAGGGTKRKSERQRRPPESGEDVPHREDVYTSRSGDGADATNDTMVMYVQ